MLNKTKSNDVINASSIWYREASKLTKRATKSATTSEQFNARNLSRFAMSDENSAIFENHDGTTNPTYDKCNNCHLFNIKRTWTEKLIT